jgi:hypothetical protein
VSADNPHSVNPPPNAEKGTQSDRPAWMTPATVVAAEGARIGLVTCLECGATLLLDPRSDIDVPRRHADYHASQTDGSGT